MASQHEQCFTESETSLHQRMDDAGISRRCTGCPFYSILSRKAEAESVGVRSIDGPGVRTYVRQRPRDMRQAGDTGSCNCSPSGFNTRSLAERTIRGSMVCRSSCLREKTRTYTVAMYTEDDRACVSVVILCCGSDDGSPRASKSGRPGGRRLTPREAQGRRSGSRRQIYRWNRTMRGGGRKVESE